MGGGSGLKYAASTIIYLSKSKEKDGTEVVGNIIKCKHLNHDSQRRTLLSQHVFYDERGLDRYYGLLELGEKYGVFEKSGIATKLVNLLFILNLFSRSREVLHAEVMQ